MPREDDSMLWWLKLRDTEKVQIGRAVHDARVAYGHAWDVILKLEEKYGEVNNPRLADTIEDLAATEEAVGRPAMTDEDFMEIAYAAILNDDEDNG